MECFLGKIAKVKNTKVLVSVMEGSGDPWMQARSFVTEAIVNKKYSKYEGKYALVFAACWIAEQYSKLKEQNEILHNKVECLDELYGSVREQKENLEHNVNVLNKEMGMLKMSAKSATAMSVSNQLLVAENKVLRAENEQLHERLKAADGHIVRLTASSSMERADNLNSEKYVSKAGEKCNRNGQISAVSHKPTESFKESKPRPIKCFSCGCLGHITKYCRVSVKERQERHNKVKCFACGHLGHIARYCPGQKERHWNQLRMCYNCGKAGHIARNCYTAKGEVKGQQLQEYGPKMEGKEREIPSSRWGFRRWQSGHNRRSHRVPYQVVMAQNHKYDDTWLISQNKGSVTCVKEEKGSLPK